MVKQSSQGLEVEQGIPSGMDCDGPLAGCAWPRLEAQPERSQLAMLDAKRIMVGQAAQPRLGQEHCVSASFNKTPHAGVDRPTNRDGQEVRAVVKERGLPTNGHRSDVSVRCQVAERLGRVDRRLGILQGLFEARQMLVVSREQKQVVSRRALEERDLKHAFVEVNGHVFAGMNRKIDVIAEQVGVQSGHKLTDVGA